MFLELPKDNLYIFRPDQVNTWHTQHPFTWAKNGPDSVAPSFTTHPFSFSKIPPGNSPIFKKIPFLALFLLLCFFFDYRTKFFPFIKRKKKQSFFFPISKKLSKNLHPPRSNVLEEFPSTILEGIGSPELENLLSRAQRTFPPEFRGKVGGMVGREGGESWNVRTIHARDSWGRDGKTFLGNNSSRARKRNGFSRSSRSAPRGCLPNQA